MKSKFVLAKKQLAKFALKNPNLGEKYSKFTLQAKLDIQNTGLVNKITSVKSKLVFVENLLHVL